MKSETIHKRKVIDFLLEWANERGEWARLLLDFIITKEAISDNERLKVFEYLEKDLGIKSNLPDLQVKNYSLDNKHTNDLTINFLSDISGVNKLAPDQILKFSKNITVIYGQNGTGKSGYSRIFKSLGYCYDKRENVVIYPNIFSNEPHKPLHAKINATINNEEKNFDWQGDNIKELNSISIYDSKSVGISTNAKREIMITPSGFHLFSIISKELSKIENILKNKVSELSVRPVLSENLHEETEQSKYFTTSFNNLTEEKLEALSSFDNKSDQQRIDDLLVQKKNLNIDVINNELRLLKLELEEIDRLTSNLYAIKVFIENNPLNVFHDLQKRLTEISKESEESISSLAQKIGVELYSSKEFISFIASAETYIKNLSNKEYPRDTDEEICIFCRQPLKNPDSRKLLSDYRKVLNSKREQEIRNIKDKISKISKAFPLANCDFNLRYPIFGTEKVDSCNRNNQKYIIPEELIKFQNSLNEIKNYFCSPNNDYTFNGAIDFSWIDRVLSEKRKGLLLTKTNKEASLSNISTITKKVTNEINSLLDKKTFSINKNILKQYLRNLKRARMLETGISKLNTKSLSTKLSEANKELICDTFSKNLILELKSLKKDYLPVSINFSVDKGISKLQQGLQNSFSISEILSEGELKAISLAEFIAEVNLNPINAPVIFDDPVNSLDHSIIDLVAKRLIKLSSTRQVIIFTHSLILFNAIFALLEQNKSDKNEHSFLETQNNAECSGIIIEDVGLKHSVNETIKKINNKLNVKKSSITTKTIKDCYDDLRSAIELLVEQKIFNRVVRRYQKNVALSCLKDVNGELIDKSKEDLNSLFERSCGFINGHSNPDSFNYDPTYEDICSDLKEFDRIYKLFK